MSENRTPRASVDTNVVISGSIIKHGNPYLVLEAWRSRHFLLVSSPVLLKEIAGVLNRSEIKRRYHLTDEEITSTIQLMESEAHSVSARIDSPVSVRDPKDDMVLAAAFNGQAEFLVTGDNDLLVLDGDARIGALRIVTPRAFLQILARTTNAEEEQDA